MNHATSAQVLKRLFLEQVIKQLKGKIFSVNFTKASGKNRHMVCRMSVANHVKGTAPDATAKRNSTLKANGMITVYEMKGKNSQYRTINLNTVTSFKCGKKEMVNFDN